MAKGRPSTATRYSRSTARRLELIKIGSSDKEVARIAFNGAVSVHKAWAIRTIRNQGAKAEDAMEILQSVLVKMWGQRNSAEGSHPSFRDWLKKSILVELMGRRTHSADGASLEEADGGIDLISGAPPAVDEYAYFHGDDEWTGDVSPFDLHLTVMPSQELFFAAYDDNTFSRDIHEILSE